MYMFTALLWHLLVAILLDLLPVSSICIDMVNATLRPLQAPYSKAHCPSLSPAGTCKQTFRISFWSLQASIIRHPLPSSMRCCHLHSHDHCPLYWHSAPLFPCLRNHLRPQAHYTALFSPDTSIHTPDDCLECAGICTNMFTALQASAGICTHVPKFPTVHSTGTFTHMHMPPVAVVEATLTKPVPVSSVSMQLVTAAICSQTSTAVLSSEGSCTLMPTVLT